MMCSVEFRLLEQSLVMHDGESPWQYHRWLMTKGEWGPRSVFDVKRRRNTSAHVPSRCPNSLYTVPSERKEEMIQRELELIDEIISTDEELSPNKPPKCTLPLLSLPLSSSL